MNTNANAPLIWDVFCNVIDNYGDVGVCYRLCRQLLDRNQKVRLWLTDHSILQWMALPQHKEATHDLAIYSFDAMDHNIENIAPSDIWIESFGCDIPMAFIEHHAKIQHWPRKWINIEYLSAQPYVDRCHGLPSPIQSGPASGQLKYFFYPGFSPLSGGLIQPMPTIDNATKHTQNIEFGLENETNFILFLFCYEISFLPALLNHLIPQVGPITVLVSYGASAQALAHKVIQQEKVSTIFLPKINQLEFDTLLSYSDFNCVRGEDSVVQAIWAGKPWLWQIYPQQDNAHHEKLAAVLQTLGVSENVRLWHKLCNAIEPVPPSEITLTQWQCEAVQIRNTLLQQDDLISKLMEFAGISSNS
jgi:uncharacterized repeat protein (TIGR03837 family)